MLTDGGESAQPWHRVKAAQLNKGITNRRRIVTSVFESQAESSPLAVYQAVVMCRIVNSWENLLPKRRQTTERPDPSP